MTLGCDDADPAGMQRSSPDYARHADAAVDSNAPSTMGSPVSSLLLTSEEGRLLDVLRGRDAAHGSRLSDVYIGALYALRNQENPERHVQAAHSMRELFEKLPIQFEGAPVRAPGAKASDHLAVIATELGKAKRHSGSYHEADDRWNGTIDEPLSRALRRIADRIDKHAEASLSRRELARTFLRAQDPLRQPLPNPSEESALDGWQKFNSYFQAVSHHNRQPNEEEFAGHMHDCALYLLGRVTGSSAQTLKVLDDIIGEGEPNAES